MEYKIIQIKNREEKQIISRFILERLTEWFGIPDARENYIKDSVEQDFFVAKDDSGAPLGFICMKKTGLHTVEVAVIGVLQDLHSIGIGKKLFNMAKLNAIAQGFSFIQVKTVQMGKYDSYDKTNHFYLKLGFKEFEVFPTLWDAHNPCQIYVMAIN